MLSGFTVIKGCRDLFISKNSAPGDVLRTRLGIGFNCPHIVFARVSYGSDYITAAQTGLCGSNVQSFCVLFVGVRYGSNKSKLPKSLGCTKGAITAPTAMPLMQFPNIEQYNERPY